MGFVLHGLDKESYDKKYSDLYLLRRLLGYFTVKWKYFLLIIITLFLASVSSSVVPAVISIGLDEIDSTDSFGTLVATITVLLVSFYILAFIFNYLTQSRSGRLVGDVIVTLRMDMFNALMNRDIGFYDKTSTGKIVSRVTNDTNDFGSVISLTTNLFSQLLVVVLLTVYMFIVNPFLALFTLLVTPVPIIVALLFRKVARRVTLKARQVIAKINALIQETITGIGTAKEFHAEPIVYDEFKRLNETSYRVGLRQGLILNLIFPLLGIIASLSIALIIYLGGLQAIGEVPTALSSFSSFFGLGVTELTLGEWYLFIQALNFYVFPLVSIASFWSQFQAGLSASERIFALMDAENEVIQENEKKIEKIDGEIEFKDVTFSYDDESGVLFDKLNLKIKPGETVAIVGHTGAGKSSFIKLLMRFYEFQSGRILVDGNDIRDLDMKDYRKKMSLISQDVFLWSGTIKENLQYGRARSEEEIDLLLKDVGADQWVGDLPDGINTEIGERGKKLSLGQRQIVAFVRVLLEDPDVLVMDEATSSIDPLTEATIQDAIHRLLKNRTSIIIAHRLTTIMHADRILVFDGGKIVEEGNHDELIKKDGYYAELYNTYYAHQSLEYIENLPSILKLET